MDSFEEFYISDTKKTFPGADVVYFKSIKLSNGQFLQVNFHEMWRKKDTYYNISISIRTKKKKDVTSKQITGRCGLEGLIMAKDIIDIFEETVTRTLCSQKGRKFYLVILGADERRQSAYRRMTKYGFKTERLFNENVLMKRMEMYEV